MFEKVCTFAPDFENQILNFEGEFWCFSFAIQNSKLISPGGGMVDTVDSKSAARKGVRVQVPPGVPRALNISALLLSSRIPGRGFRSIAFKHSNIPPRPSERGNVCILPHRSIPVQYLASILAISAFISSWKDAGARTSAWMFIVRISCFRS